MRRPEEVQVFVCRRSGEEILVLLRSAEQGGYWHPASGALEEGERPEEAAVRELREELDLDAAGRFWPVRYEYGYDAAEEPPERRAQWPPGTERVAVTGFILEAPADFEPSLNWEHDDYRWCSIAEALELFYWSDVGEALQELWRRAIPELVGLRIRDARPDDALALAKLVGQLGYPTSQEAMARRLDRLRSSEADRVVVADMQGEVVGLASLHISLAVEYDEPVAKLSAIVVDENHRRRGIGETLVSEMEAEARRRHCGLIFLTTAERRDDAHAFYRRIGLEETGRRFAKCLR